MKRPRYFLKVLFPGLVIIRDYDNIFPGKVWRVGSAPFTFCPGVKTGRGKPPGRKKVGFHFPFQNKNLIRLDDLMKTIKNVFTFEARLFLALLVKVIEKEFL